MNSLSASQEQFISAVLALKPQLAVFDCDGTLWSKDAGEGFFFWEISQGLLPADRCEWGRTRYAEYRAGRVAEEPMCGEMVTIHEGIADAKLAEAGERYFAQHVAPAIFPEMLELLRRLHSSGCEIWAVSSTNDWVINAAARKFGIPLDRVLAAKVERVSGCATSRLVRVPTDHLKAVAIREVIGRAPDAVFGNSMHDVAMMELARHAFAVNPNADLEVLAMQRGWTVYRPVNRS